MDCQLQSVRESLYDLPSGQRVSRSSSGFKQILGWILSSEVLLHAFHAGCFTKICHMEVVSLYEQVILFPSDALQQ
jgi:hypothetical protein